MRFTLKLLKILTISALPFCLASCAHKTTSVVFAQVGYVNVNSMPVGNSSINNIRLQALKEGAMSLGARGALAWRSEHIDQALENESSYLTHIFDFNQLLLNQNVLPPVLVESQGDLTLDNNDTLRAANKTFKIVSEARFVTAPPTWQTYLWMSYQKPNVPSKALLPTNRAEAYAWNQFLKQGWQQGVNQANEIFSENLSRLKRDYLGMVLYRKLLAANMISSPIVSKAELGITGNKHEMRIDDAIMRITAHSALQLNSQKWNPILTK